MVSPVPDSVRTSGMLSPVRSRLTTPNVTVVSVMASGIPTMVASRVRSMVAALTAEYGENAARRLGTASEKLRREARGALSFRRDDLRSMRWTARAQTALLPGADVAGYMSVLAGRSDGVDMKS